jgi:hypothetical protein
MYRTLSGTALPTPKIRSPDGIAIPTMDLGHLFSWFNEVEKSASADEKPTVSEKRAAGGGLPGMC